MLRIAVCDDMSDELQSLVSLTNQYISDNSLDAEVTKYSHPDVLLTAIGTKLSSLHTGHRHAYGERIGAW
ncbi:MAG: hypothetical protein VB111_06265 [Clostridiaceae bacterium]|nr:hypothetical protein [Clostridiaceae bacterium]